MTTQDFPPVTVREVTSRRPVWRSFARNFAAACRVLAAGMAASKDYRHLEAMTDSQLKQIGLSRKDIPREIYRRHFEGLRSPDASAGSSPEAPPLGQSLRAPGAWRIAPRWPVRMRTPHGAAGASCEAPAGEA